MTKQPKISDDYGHGQMMGMLVMIQLMEDARDNGTLISNSTIETIKHIASEDLAEYLDKPQEDIMLLVEQQLRTIQQ